MGQKKSRRVTNRDLRLFSGLLPQQLSNHHADVKQNCYDYEDQEHRVQVLVKVDFRVQVF